MVRFITVEREYGSEGAEYAAALAEKLGWKLYDRELVEVVAREAGVPVDEAAVNDEKADAWFSRLSRGFLAGGAELGLTPSGVDSDKMVGHLQNALHALAKEGHCVIVGRGGSNVLCGTHGAFHVFTYASMPHKKRWYVEKYPDRAADAEHEIHAADAAHAAYIKKHYNRDWADRHLYHLLLNSCMGIEAMVKATVDAMGQIG